MRSRWKGSAALQRLFLLLFFVFALVAVAKDDQPNVKRSKFPNALQEILYFDDSEIILATDRYEGDLHRSTDAGETWDNLGDLAGNVVKVFMNPTDNKVAIALGSKGKHWITKDRGEEWRSFKLDAQPDFLGSPVSFHSLDRDKVIINTRSPTEGMFYTTDGFKSDPKRFDVKALRCIWAKEQPRFSERVGKDVDDRSTLCIAEGKYSASPDDFRLLISDDYFKTSREPEMENGRTVSGIVNMVAVKGYVLAARMSQSSSEMALYTTIDTKQWNRAHFGQDELHQGGYTIMESTNYSVQVDVAVKPPALEMGMLFTSNSKGDRFSRNEAYTNRNRFGFVDFEKIQNIQGIVLVNHVANWEAVLKGLESKKVVSQISFDDGRSFHDLTVKDEKLHLHSITDQSNVGRIFSSPAPGLVMGVGNIGPHLEQYGDGDTCVSDDAGLHWKCPLEGPHKYEFGDQGSILLAIPDRDGTKKMTYSFDHGESWKTYEFDDEVRPLMLTTVPDSTSLKFVLQVTEGRGQDIKHVVYAIDFGKVDVKTCKDDDFEKWYVRQTDDDKPGCIMGHKQFFRRRKPDSHCFVRSDFREPLPDTSETCTCTVDDYECDEGFYRSPEDKKECVPGVPLKPPEGKCKSPDDKFEGPSGYRVIPGNDCIRKDGPKLAKSKEWSCGAAQKPSDGKISNEVTTFPAGGFKEYYYLENEGREDGDPETVVALTDQRRAYISHDHGKKWAALGEGDEIWAIYPNRYDSKDVYLITPSKKVWHSNDRGKQFQTFDAPGIPNNAGLQVLHFHPKNSDWLIWTSCMEDSSLSCKPQAHASLKGGEEWTILGKLVENCEFVWEESHRADVDKKRIFCVKRDSAEVDRKQLLASDDLFANKDVVFDDVLNFATMSEYIIVAAKTGDENKYLKVDASIDAKTFADAKFPPRFDVPHQTAYTVLDSSTHAIFLHVTTYGVKEQEFGTIIKSNSNGTFYVMSIEGVNRNYEGYVDFEKMFGLEGVAIVNIVANEKDVRDGRSKKLKTKITHSDGAFWDSISPPSADALGNEYKCDDKSPEKCSLHLHGYTERRDPRDTFSSQSAVGLMMGIGNVGEYLGRKQEGDTFISTDGGIKWKCAKKGQFMWEFGDQGSIIVIVEESVPTSVVFYSIDEGEEWKEYRFSDHDVLVNDITTVPSDTSRNFLLWGRDSTKAITINLDFSGLINDKCELDEKLPNSKDYRLWVPKHPQLDRENCLFGHVTQYLRKKPQRNCYNGLPRLKQPWNIKENCSCTERDFECDYNYERTSGNTCKLVKGLSPKDPKEVCKDPKVVEYYDPTGYRKIPLSTCKNGKELEMAATPHACPGHEREYAKRHGISGAGLFFAIVLPIAAACGIGYWVYRNYEGRFGLGRIRLETPSGSGASDWLKWPVAIISGAAAVMMAVPMVIGTLYRGIRERLGYSSWHSQRSRYGGAARPYTSRSSFARGRGDYTAVGANDESDLLGEDDSDDDI